MKKTSTLKTSEDENYIRNECNPQNARGKKQKKSKPDIDAARQVFVQAVKAKYVFPLVSNVVFSAKNVKKQPKKSAKVSDPVPRVEVEDVELFSTQFLLEAEAQVQNEMLAAIAEGDEVRNLQSYLV